MANLTSLYCNKHTTVLVNVHVRPVLWPRPAQPPPVRPRQPRLSSLRWRLPGRCVLVHRNSLLPRYLKTKQKQNSWTERWWWRQTCEGHSPYCLTRPCYWLVWGKMKKRGGWRVRRGGREGGTAVEPVGGQFCVVEPITLTRLQKRSNFDAPRNATLNSNLHPGTTQKSCH